MVSAAAGLSPNAKVTNVKPTIEDGRKFLVLKLMPRPQEKLRRQARQRGKEASIFGAES